MRAFCTVSAPLEVCASSAEQLSPGSRFLTLRLLGNQQPKALYFLVDAKSRVREVYTQTCLHFSTQGMLDTELFGLAVLIDGEYLFADPENKLSKYGPKSWRSSHTHGLDANGRPLLELYFRVQFYIESPLLLKDETTRHNYYLQLKYNALHRDIPNDYSEQSMILLAGLALQADLGDVPLGVKDATSKTKGKINGNGNENGNGNGNGKFQESNDQLVQMNANHDTKLTETNVISATTATTTLPKLYKGTNTVNERVLRLSRYIPHVNQAAAVGGGAGGGGGSIENSGNSKNFVNKIQKHAVHSTGPPPALSPATSTSSISRGPSSASTNASTSTDASSRADYFRLEDYLPPYLRTARAASTLRACHRENRGMSASDAEMHYIQHACTMHECINAHTFRMRLTKNENGPGNSWFVVYAKGIIIFASRGIGGNNIESNHLQQQITFLWPNITKLSFERKKFEIRSGESKITLFASCDEKNKMLLTLCRDTHQFSMKIAARLKEVIKREEDESNCLHASYIYSRSLHLPPYKNKSDQRISVISSTSSNTTSGIVSDRVHSEDELEIMINSPPVSIAAPSTESLALAHLLDHQPSVSRQASSVGQISLKDLKEHLAALSIEQNKSQTDSQLGGTESPTHLSNTSSAGNSSSTSGGSLHTAGSKRNADESSTSIESPTSQHNIGSQCSSTCSTVVVASSTSDNLSSLATLSTRSNLKTTNANNNCNNQRRNSTSSSLELGFSHTAQNSMLSEIESTCIGHDFTQIDGVESESNIEVYTMAGGTAPTETSGVYTMNSSELTGQSSEIAESEKNSNYGLFHSRENCMNNVQMLADVQDNLEDSVDGGRDFHHDNEANNEFRSRSDSNISTSGSFRGDGSDPTGNKYNLLSVEELTDLIVGRGTYPNHATISNTLDSDCDYVTLPLSIAGESYLQGHQDTAPTDDHGDGLINDLLSSEPPILPERIDSQNIRTDSPPPYNFRHRKTGLCGPPITSCENIMNFTLTSRKCNVPGSGQLEKSLSSLKTTDTSLAPVVKRKDPPPYTLSSIKNANLSFKNMNTPNHSLSHIGDINIGHIPERRIHSAKSEEITARFITSRPQINILKAHTTAVNDNAKPSFAAPTNYSSSSSLSRHNLSSNLSQHSLNNSNYVSGSQTSLNFKPHHHLITAPKICQHTGSIPAAAVAHVHSTTNTGVLPNSIGIPITPYALRGVNKSMTSLQQSQTELKAQPACVLLPVIKPRQYLPPPPPSIPRQPPPPPPTHYNIYSSHVARKQLELYQQQLCSDVDYVIYPLQDPAVSQQEYLDAKQSSLLAAMAQTQTPHHHQHPYLAAYHQAAASAAWETLKGHAIYRSTPYLPLTLSSHSRYASTQNLSDSYVQLPNAYSPLYSRPLGSLCQSCDAPPPPPPPLHPTALRRGPTTTTQYHHTTTPLYVRSLSDENILNSLDLLPKVKRLPPPPPPPPPYVNRRLKKPPMPIPTVASKPPPIPMKPLQNTSSNLSTTPDIRTRTHTTTTATTTITTNSLSHNDSQANTNNSNEMHRCLGGAINRCKVKTDGHLTKQSRTHNHNILTNLLLSSSSSSTSPPTSNELDIALLREKSRNLDLPLISALCNDRLLLKQTKMLVNQSNRLQDGKNNDNINNNNNNNNILNATTKIIGNNDSNILSGTYTSSTERMTRMTTSGTTTTMTLTTSCTTSCATAITATAAAVTTTAVSTTATTQSSINNNGNNNSKINKPSISHRHPNDKLPPLPMQMAEANNYVMDPAIIKHHKGY